MVNRGRSGGCITCKERRIKCDEEKPECRTCQRLGLHCGGYNKKPTKLKFRDQNHKFCSAVSRSRADKAQEDWQVAVPGPRSLSEPDSAVSFFLGHYAGMGRDAESARGFFEMLIPVYYSQRQDSALSLAVSAVASTILSLWRWGPGNSQRLQKSYMYGQAIACLRRATQHRTERAEPATVLAALTLQLYENIAAVYGFRYPTPIHHNGALSLIQFADADLINVTTNAYLRKFMLHTEISSAMRQKRPPQNAAYSWIRREDLIAVPNNPSSALDAIGASVAELQANYMKLINEDDSTSSPRRDLAEWRAEARQVDEQLLAWARCVPDHWQPLKVVSGQDIDPSIPTYRSVCEIYASCQVATIWNLWRIQRLVLASLTLSSLNGLTYPSQCEISKGQSSSIIEEFVRYEQTLQELMDGLCYSVPFYLGNRSGLSRLNEFTDPAILLPSFHSLAPEDKRNVQKQNHKLTVLRDEHKRDLIARGPWQVMSPLSRVLALLSEDHTRLVASFLRMGQHEWIREQFLRVINLLGLPPRESGDSKVFSYSLNPLAQGLAEPGVEHLVTGVRKGLSLMSGP